MTDTICAIGERDGKVVMSFPRPIPELVIDAEQARQMGEQFARCAYVAQTGRQPSESKSMISEHLRKSLGARAGIVIRTLLEQGKSAEYIGKHITSIILSEVA